MPNFPATCTSIHCVQIAFKFWKLCAVVEKKLCWQSFQYYFQYSNGQNWKFKKSDYVPSKNNGSSIDGSLTNVFPWKIYLLLCTVIFVTLTHKNVKNNKQNCDMRIKYHRIILYLSMLVSQWPWSTFQSECPTNQMLLKFQSVTVLLCPSQQTQEIFQVATSHSWRNDLRLFPFHPI